MAASHNRNRLQRTVGHATRLRGRAGLKKVQCTPTEWSEGTHSQGRGREEYPGESRTSSKGVHRPVALAVAASMKEDVIPTFEGYCKRTVSSHTPMAIMVLFMLCQPARPWLVACYEPQARDQPVSFQGRKVVGAQRLRARKFTLLTTPSSLQSHCLHP